MSGEEVDDCLMVKVLEARNLMVTESGTPQPYAEVRVGSVSETTETSEASDTSETQRTKVPIFLKKPQKPQKPQKP